MSNMLLVIDMLNDFVHENGVLSFQFARNIVPFVKKRIALHRADNNKIIFLCDAHNEDDLEFQRFPAHAIDDTWGAKIIDDLELDVSDIILKKTRYSGFYGTNLDFIIELEGPEKVEVVGVCTSICVMDTVGGLANRDYRITVPVKGVADFDNNNHMAALDRMETLYGAKIIEE